MKSLFYTPSSKTLYKSYDRYKLLGQIAVVLNKYLVAFSTNRTPITAQQASELNTMLNKVKTSTMGDFEHIRLVMVNSLQSLLTQIDLYVQYQNIVSNLASIAQKASILDSIDAILGYLKMIRASPFPDQTVTVIAASVVPQYAEYVRRYGKPANGIFDPVKLADIVAELEA
jgi:hypothetical protein